jgi:hypothetical protein
MKMIGLNLFFNLGGHSVGAREQSFHVYWVGRGQTGLSGERNRIQEIASSILMTFYLVKGFS